MSESVKPPDPWEGPLFVAVGGLWALGFDPEERIYCVSSSGVGVLDPRTGEKLARDREDDRYDDATERVRGLGPSAGHNVVVAGDGGGIQTRYRLPTTTQDGWRVAVSEPAVGGAVMLVGPNADGVPVADVEPLRAHGFSPSGRFLVLGESHTVTLFRRCAVR